MHDPIGTHFSETRTHAPTYTHRQTDILRSLTATGSFRHNQRNSSTYRSSCIQRRPGIKSVLFLICLLLYPDFAPIFESQSAAQSASPAPPPPPAQELDQ